MKKLLIICLLAALPLMYSAGAEENPGCMQVVNCEEWVSLRAEPDKSADRVEKVPLGAIVENCLRHSDEWIYAEYDGRCGYILSQYLDEDMSGDEGVLYPCEMSISELRGNGEELFRYEESGCTVIAAREFSGNESETLRVGCYRDDGLPVWGWVTETNCRTELNGTEAFIGGDGEYRQVLIYNSMYGLAAVDFYDGTQNWLLSRETMSLGASICHAVAPDGINYIAGFYGPDPVAISMDGEVLWKSSVGDDAVYWPYEITTAADALLVNYDSCLEGGCYQAAFDYATGDLRCVKVIP